MYDGSLQRCTSQHCCRHDFNVSPLQHVLWALSWQGLHPKVGIFVENLGFLVSRCCSHGTGTFGRQGPSTHARSCRSWGAFCLRRSSRDQHRESTQYGFKRFSHDMPHMTCQGSSSMHCPNKFDGVPPRLLSLSFFVSLMLTLLMSTFSPRWSWSCVQRVSIVHLLNAPSCDRQGQVRLKTLGGGSTCSVLAMASTHRPAFVTLS